MTTASRRVPTGLLAALPLLLLWPPLRQLLEGSMALHMLVELPLLLASGWAAGAVLEIGRAHV